MRETSSLLFCNTPHGEAVRASVAVVRDHVATGEVQVVPVRTTWRARPIEAAAAHVVQLPIAGVAIPRSGEDSSSITISSCFCDSTIRQHIKAPRITGRSNIIPITSKRITTIKLLRSRHAPLLTMNQLTRSLFSQIFTYIPLTCSAIGYFIKIITVSCIHTCRRRQQVLRVGMSEHLTSIHRVTADSRFFVCQQFRNKKQVVFKNHNRGILPFYEVSHNRERG